jgi:acyl carrier protein
MRMDGLRHLNFLANQGCVGTANPSSANLRLTSAMLANAELEISASASEGKIAKVVQRLLLDHSIDRTFYVQDDLREVGLTSLDMASLVLAVEAEFDLMIPEREITPANFRSVSTITNLVTGLLGSNGLVRAETPPLSP